RLFPFMFDSQAFCDERGIVFGGVHREVKGEFADLRLFPFARMPFCPPCAQEEKEERAGGAARRERAERRCPKPVQVKAEYAEKEEKDGRKHENRIRPERKVKTFHNFMRRPGNSRPAAVLRPRTPALRAVYGFYPDFLIFKRCTREKVVIYY